MSFPSSIDIAIIGAGAAGLGAAHALQDKGVSFIVLEARDRIGGRAHTIMASPDVTFDLGCGWLHSADRNSFVGIAEQLAFTIDTSRPPWRDQAYEAAFPREEREEFIRALEAFFMRTAEAARSGRDAPASICLEPGNRWNGMIDAICTYLNGCELAQMSPVSYTHLDFFLHSGDTIYADGPIKSEVKLPDNKVWKNLTVEEKAKVAETLDEFRAAHKYNFLDENVRAFNAEVPIFVQWDDHEVTNNWSASKELPAAYKERNIQLLAARAARAFHEMYPMRESIIEPGRVYRTINYGPHLDVFVLDERSYRGANGPNLEDKYGPASYFIGPEQMLSLIHI